MSFLGNVFGSILDIGKSIVGAVPIVGDTASSIIGAVVDPISNALGISPEQQAQQDSRDFQMDVLTQQQDFASAQAKQAHDWNVHDWQMNNEYNSPLAQKKRLQEAGLNPLLADTGSGLSSAITSTAPASPSAPSSDLSALASMITAQSDLAMRNEQLQALKLENEKRRIDNAFLWEKNTLVNQGLSANIRLTFADEKLKYKLADKAANECQVLQASLGKISSDIERNQAEVQRLIAQKHLDEEQARKVFLENLYTQQTWEDSKRLLKAKAKCTEAQAAEYLASAALCRSNTEFADLTNEFLAKTMAFRVETTRHGMRLVDEQVRTEHERGSVLYWDQNQKRFNYEFDVENKEDLMYFNITKDVVQTAAQVAGAGALIYGSTTKQPASAAKRQRVNYNGTDVPILNVGY